MNHRLQKYLHDNFKLDWYGIHGAPHWGRVHLNGMLLLKTELGRQDVLTLFALLHDSCRENDESDPAHGQRACQLAYELRGEYFEIDDYGFKALGLALFHHSDGHTFHDDASVRICWDADRLDLGRVGIKPDPKYLCTPTARDPKFIEAAYRRSRI